MHLNLMLTNDQSVKIKKKNVFNIFIEFYNTLR